MPYIARPIRKHRSHKKKFIALSLLVLIGLGVWVFVFKDKAAAPDDAAVSTSQTGEDTSSEPVYEPVDLQPTIDAWVAEQSATYAVVVYDHQAKKVIAENLPDKSFFAASLYKLPIAYLSLLDFQNSTQDPDEILTGGFSRKQCVDKMIRESHSPCGEAMMADIGQTTLNERVKDMGMSGTFFNGIRITAADSALILQHILNKRELNDENTAFLKDAMLTQDAKYKRGLQTGAPGAKWETKVGWNEDSNYHDIGIMTMPDGRQFAVAILGQGSGSSKPIADFAATLFSALTLE